MSLDSPFLFVGVHTRKRTADRYLREAKYWHMQMIDTDPEWQHMHAEKRMWENLLLWALYREAA